MLFLIFIYFINCRLEHANVVDEKHLNIDGLGFEMQLKADQPKLLL